MSGNDISRARRRRTGTAGLTGAASRRSRGASAALLIGLLFFAAPELRADPRIDYILHCRGCHGPEGAGVPGTVPNLRGEVAKFLRVDGGREYLVRVPGVAQSALDDRRTAELLNWMMREFGPAEAATSAAPFSASEVAQHRRSPLTDVEPIRRALIKRMAR